MTSYFHIESSSSFKGDGAIANILIPSHAVILSEKPLVALQSLPNRRDVVVCSNCFIFLSVKHQLNILQKNYSRQDISVAAPNSNDCPCLNNCGELYCSDACRKSHTGHGLLCTGCIPDEEASEHPLFQFKVHACQTNEIFLLVGDIFAKICTAIENSDGFGEPRESSVTRALSPYSNYCRKLWWEVAIAPVGVDPVEFAHTLQCLVKDSWELLSTALKLRERGLISILNEDYFSRTIGMFEQNNVGIRLSNPLASLASQYTLENEAVQFVALLTPASESFDESASANAECVDEVLSHMSMIPGPTFSASLKTKSIGNEYLVSCANDITLPEFLSATEIIAKSLDEEETCNDEDCDEDCEWEDAEDEGLCDEGGNVDEVTPLRSDEVDPVRAAQRLKYLIEAQEADRLYPPLDGTAFYSTICKINHSCVPNVMVKYTSTLESGLIAQLHTLRSIDPGEELLQSYIDQNMPFDERKAALKDYGFECTCEKCELES